MLLLGQLKFDFCREKAAEGLKFQGKLSRVSQLEISILNLLVVWMKCSVCLLLVDLKPKDKAYPYLLHSSALLADVVDFYVEKTYLATAFTPIASSQ